MAHRGQIRFQLGVEEAGALAVGGRQQRPVLVSQRAQRTGQRPALGENQWPPFPRIEPQIFKPVQYPGAQVGPAGAIVDEPGLVP